MLRKLRHTIANRLNERGARASDRGASDRATRYYTWASKLDPEWSVPWYNLGLQSKYVGDWEASYRYNQRASSLNQDDEAAWWNLGIAATALSDWREARRAWARLGIDVPAGEGECEGPIFEACVRIDPAGCGEVVWGEPIDPARFIVLNVPLPESGRRFRDILLNDGAVNGTRLKNDVEVPVFDELAVWRPSQYSTFEVVLEGASNGAEAALIELCHEYELGIEDWSTIRLICAECSGGNLGPHDCKRGSSGSPRSAYAIAARSESDLRRAVQDWEAVARDRRCLNVAVVLSA